MYRYMVRHMERSGQSVFLMLCSFRGKLEEGVEGSDRLRQVCEAFSAAAAKSLRRSDSYTRYSPTQFLLMLLGTDQENCHRIAERLIANFKREFNGRGVSIHYTVLSSLNVENLGMNADLRWKK